MAAGITYTPIATTTLGSDTGIVTFSSISGSYTDLVLVINGGFTGSSSYIYLQFNSDTGTNYSRTELYGNGSVAGSTRGTNENYAICGITAISTTDPAVSIINIQNYSNSSTYKTIISRGSSSASLVEAYAALWRNTSAINSITISNNNFSAYNFRFAAGSTFSLYGITAA